MRTLPTTVSHILSSCTKSIRSRGILLSNIIKFLGRTAHGHAFDFEAVGKHTCAVGKNVQRGSVKINARNSAAQLKENWLASLSYPFEKNEDEDAMQCRTERVSCQSDGGWIIGVDPDVSGALALLKGDDLKCSAQVFDSPYLKVLVGKRVRKRLDAKSIAHLLQRLNVPVGTMAYVEQSTPYPQDGKQGWWSGGFGYGLWLGILVASGCSVVPVPSIRWKNQFELSGSPSSKDSSRFLASMLFPSVSHLLKRKKDHGRAEALLIAAYGKGIKHESCVVHNVAESISGQVLVENNSRGVDEACTFELYPAVSVVD